MVDLIEAEPMPAGRSASARRLDWSYVETQLAGLADLAGDPDLPVRLRRLRAGAALT